MSRSLRILSWNTQMRSWGMEMGFPPSIPPVTTAEERAELIADAILASPFDYDIVGLCEVFDEDSRDILRNRLRGRFPWIVTKCDFGFIGTELGSAPLIDLPLQGMTFVSGLIFTPWKILDYRPEDSGLMLFSKWPFATTGLVTLPQELVGLLQTGPLGSAIPAEIPSVNFLPYTDTTDNDKFAAKGVLYARIEPTPGERFHIFFSHTQADTDNVEENADERADQMRAVEKFVTGSIGGFPANGEVFFMGDLNIRGEQADDADPNREWATTFNSSRRILHDQLVDLWGRSQCTGSKGLRDPGVTASVRYPPQQQRLDYILGSVTSQLAAQHMMIDYTLSTVPPGHPEVSFMSDHLPLRLELARPRPFSTPHGAMPVTVPMLLQSLIFTDTQWLIEGQVVWYRFDKAGTYNFTLGEGADRCAFEVYLDTDLSRPRRQYRNEIHPDFGPKFVLASAPFLVKVFPLSRHGEVRVQFRAHLHQGTSPEDHIGLPYGVPVPEAFPEPTSAGGQLLNADDWRTPWDDKDTKWFRLDGPQISLSTALAVTLTVEATRGDSPFGVRLVQQVGLTWKLISDTGSGPQRKHDIGSQIDKGQQLFVCVYRDDLPALRPLEFTVTARTNLSLLLGGPPSVPPGVTPPPNRGQPRFICTKETSGWGADDIELDITVDGKALRYISNDEIGDMEGDAVRDLAQWIPEFVPYLSGVNFRIIELDDIDPNDIGSQSLPTYDQLGGSSVFWDQQRNPDGSVRGSLRVNVDDGQYDVQLTIVTWDEQF
jgi:endonuclease/exonuclease/phosphatase family metal-dependent hydrolase